MSARFRTADNVGIPHSDNPDADHVLNKVCTSDVLPPIYDDACKCLLSNKDVRSPHLLCGQQTVHDYHTTVTSSSLLERSTACDGICMPGRLARHLPLGGLTETCCVQSSFRDKGDIDMLDCTVIPAHPCSSSNAMNSPGLLPQLMFPLSPSQPSAASTGSALRSFDRFHSEPHPSHIIATQHVRKRGANACGCSGVQCCQLHRAQANFRKSLRRGFLSPWTCEGSSESLSSGHTKLTDGCVTASASAPTAGREVRPPRDAASMLQPRHAT